MYSTISHPNSGAHSLRAKIYHSELQFIAECVLRCPSLETGGDFFGFWSKDGEPVILYALGPGQGATGTGTSFYQDIGYLRECGTALNSQFALEHIGAWHSHHQLGLYTPSSGDVRTMRNALSRSHPTRFLICICNIEKGGSVAISPFLFTKESTADYSSCGVHVLPGASPIRDRMQYQGVSVTTQAEAVHRQENAHYLLRPPDSHLSINTNERTEKPQLPENSYWARREGQRVLKTIFDNLKTNQDLAEIEVKQIADGRIAISFEHSGTEYEIRFPDDYPAKTPYAVVTGKSSGKFWKKNPQVEAVQRILDSLPILENNRSVVILKPQ